MVGDDEKKSQSRELRTEQIASQPKKRGDGGLMVRVKWKWHSFYADPEATWLRTYAKGRRGQYSLWNRVLISAITVGKSMADMSGRGLMVITFDAIYSFQHILGRQYLTQCAS